MKIDTLEKRQDKNEGWVSKPLSACMDESESENITC